MSTAEKSTKHFTLELTSIVLRNVVTQRLVKYMMKLEYVLSVASHFQLTNMENRNFVAVNVYSHLCANMRLKNVLYVAKR